jgi:hypothetical protein
MALYDAVLGNISLVKNDNIFTEEDSKHIICGFTVMETASEELFEHSNNMILLRPVGSFPHEGKQLF